MNPAKPLPISDRSCEDRENYDNPERYCIEVTELCTKPRPDIIETPLEMADLTLFVDSSCLRDQYGELRAACIIYSISETLEASSLPNVTSVQVSDLVALTRACYFSGNLNVTIYINSQYGFGVVHDFGQLWPQRGFITSSGASIKSVHTYWIC